MNNSYNILISKLNKFIRKYYFNLIIKGIILSVSILLLLFIAVSLIEYFSWNNVLTRTIFFYIYIAVTFAIVIYYIIIPALKIISIGNTLSHEDAARIIGRHFKEVDDKLINALQLHNQHGDTNVELLVAGIEQKADQLSPVPFSKAISFKANLKFLKYAIPVILILIAILLISPSLVIEPSKRIIDHNSEYLKPLPYSIRIVNQDFSVPQHNDFTLELVAEGEQIPAKIWVFDGNYRYRAIEAKPGFYEYVFKDVARDIYFQIETDDYISSKYRLQVYPKPIIFNIEANLTYPRYLNIQNETIENGGNMILPEGTQINWQIFTRDTRSVEFYIDDSLHILEADESNVLNLEYTASHDFTYALIASNEFMRSSDSMYFDVQIIKDEYPSIKVEEYKDENSYGIINFSGQISDDHGFHSLKFAYRKDSVPQKKWEYISLIIEPAVSDQIFDYMINIADFNLGPGESVNYFFEVRDNDSYNGYKASKSDMHFYRMPESNEIEEKIEDKSDELKSMMSESVREIQQLDEQIEDTRLDLFEKKNMSWADKQKLSELLEKKENLKKQLDEIRKLNEDIKSLEEMLKKKLSPELEEKLKELEKLFEELFDKELKEEIEKLKEDLEKENISELLNKMKEQNEDLKNDLEQNLELFKQMEFEQIMEEAISELDKLAEEQIKEGEKNFNKEQEKEQSIKEQQKLNEEFNETVDKLKKADELNKELEDPFNMEVDTATSESIEQQMNDAQGDLEKNKRKKASENQKGAGQKMKEMANALSMMMNAAMMERTGEDIELIRNMLDNLLDLSFEQEEMILELRAIGKNDPKNVELREKQKGAKDEFLIINDSLEAMSKRQIAIRGFVVKESGKIINYIDRALDNMQEQKQGAALSEQQYALTSMNNLALMLAESLDQMQQSMQMQGGKKGSSKCKNPGQGSSPSMSEILKQQQGLNKSMNGKMKKKGKDGKDGQGGINKNSEELARMAAAQGEIRRMLQEFIDQLEAEGGNGGNLNKLVEEMQKSEEDIINRRLSLETLQRQKNIESRLLKSEKALQEREKEQKRESKSGKNKNSGNQNKKIEYKSDKENQEEILITVPIEVKPYYKKLLKEYLYKLENDKGNGK